MRRQMQWKTTWPWCLGFLLTVTAARFTDAQATQPDRGGTPLALKTDEALRPAVEKCFHVQALRDTRDNSLVELMIQVDHPPVGMGFMVSLKAGGKVLPVGPIAWGTSMEWWAFDIDVPPNAETIELILTPDPQAAALLKKSTPWKLEGLEFIWNGEVDLKDVKVQTQRLDGMIPVAPPAPQVALQEQMPLLDGKDSIIVQFKRDGDLAAARRALAHAVQATPKDATAWFDLGCLTLATNDFSHAMGMFATVRQLDPASSLADKAQRQLRQLGGYLRFLASQEDVPAMVGLGNMFEFGWGPSADRQEAKKWYRNAANASNSDAMVRLGVMYQQDLEAGQSDPKAKAWYQQQVVEMYRRAAQLGNQEAQKWVASHK